jgi:hypothetical protein
MKVFIEPTHFLENILDFLAQLPKTDFEYHFIVDSDDHLQGYTYIEENTITVAVADEKDILTLAHECVHMSFYQQKGDKWFDEIVERAAKLICTTPEFDDLAKEVGLGSHLNGVTNEVQRAKLRAELDGIIAHLYQLTEVEFAHILTTFPIVPDPTKQAALNAYRDVERGL